MSALWAWLCANIGTVIVCVALVAVVASIIAWMIYNKRKGKSMCSCGGSCGACGMNCSCNQAKK